MHPFKVDPLDVLGIRPAGPLPYWAGGNIPDQYGRRSMDDDGETPLPAQPAQWHPMFANQWPPDHTLPVVDLTEVDIAIQTGDAQKFLASITKCNIDDGLHHIAAGAPCCWPAALKNTSPWSARSSTGYLGVTPQETENVPMSWCSSGVTLRMTDAVRVEDAVAEPQLER